MLVDRLPFLGGTSTWQELSVDVRTYRKLTSDSRRKLAFWFLGEEVHSPVDIRLDQADRVVTCTITRGEILFGIVRLPSGRRRTELEETGRQFLAAVRCEPVPERAGDHTQLRGKRNRPRDRPRGGHRPYMSVILP